MRVPAISVRSMTDQHIPTSPAVSHAPSPAASMASITMTEEVYAQRLEHALRTGVATTAVVATLSSDPPPRPPGRMVKAYKRVCDTAALVCGVAAVPSLALGVFNIWLLLVPTVLICSSVILMLLRGAPTQEIEQDYAARAAAAREYDSQGV